MRAQGSVTPCRAEFRAIIVRASRHTDPPPPSRDIFVPDNTLVAEVCAAGRGRGRTGPSRRDPDLLRSRNALAPRVPAAPIVRDRRPSRRNHRV